MAPKAKILLLGEIAYARDAWSAVEAIAQVIRPTSRCREDFKAESRSGAFDGVSTVYRTFDSFKLTGHIDADLLDAMPKSIKFICHTGAGYDQVKVDDCSQRGIRVSHTPNAVDDATADLAMWLILGCLRNFPAHMAVLRAGAWQDHSTLPIGHDPQDKILGILGMGGIGRNLAAKARPFGMKIRYHNRSPLSPELANGAEYVDFETLLRESDILSLNLPLNSKTHHTISTPQFALMKNGVVIVNTARGAVMDEDALVAALDSGHVSSVGLDVFENEPKVHPGLLAHQNVLLLPHVGTWTVETQTKMEDLSIRNVHLAVSEGRLKTPVPEQVHMR